MTRALIRPCLGCKRPVRGKPRCHDCQRTVDASKRKRRPDLHNNAAERRRRQRAVADHRAIVGDWCPGVPELRRPAHLSADLTADHVKEVARGGRPDGRLVVRCRSCNAARSAHLARRVLTAMQVNDPSPGEVGDTLRDGGPVVA
jgi:hypothetical protein